MHTGMCGVGSRPVTSLGHQGGDEFFEWGLKFFALCSIDFNCVQNIFPGGRKFFYGGFAPPLVTGLVGRQWRSQPKNLWEKNVSL